jgi:hypothetical protein
LQKRAVNAKGMDLIHRIEIPRPRSKAGAALRGVALNRPGRGDRLALGPGATRRTAGGLGDEPESETAGGGG